MNIWRQCGVYVMMNIGIWYVCTAFFVIFSHFMVLFSAAVSCYYWMKTAVPRPAFMRIAEGNIFNVTFRRTLAIFFLLASILYFISVALFFGWFACFILFVNLSPYCLDIRHLFPLTDLCFAILPFRSIIIECLIPLGNHCFNVVPCISSLLHIYYYIICIFFSHSSHHITLHCCLLHASNYPAWEVVWIEPFISLIALPSYTKLNAYEHIFFTPKYSLIVNAFYCMALRELCCITPYYTFSYHDKISFWNRLVNLSSIIVRSYVHIGAEVKKSSRLKYMRVSFASERSFECGYGQTNSSLLK